MPVFIGRLPIVFLAALGFCQFAKSAGATDVIADANHFTVKVIAAVQLPLEHETKGTGKGAGFLVDRERGWILTNAHVASRSPSSIQVSFKNLPLVKAEKVYVDDHLDVAVLKIDPAHIPDRAVPARLQCASDYPPGRPVIAFGHPWWLNYTATRGIISGVNVSEDTEWLQTDGALNPGNSGGALIDTDTGLVVGISTASLKSGGAEGLHFAVPIRLVCTIRDLLKQGKDPTPPLLPVMFATTENENELVVAKASGEWSKKFKIGDYILSVDGDRHSRTLSRVLDHMRGKKRVRFTVQRDGKEHEIEVEAPGERDKTRHWAMSVSGMIIGRRTAPESDDSKLYIHFVDEASLAEQAQFFVGDQVTSIDGKVIDSYDAVRKTLPVKSGAMAQFIIRRERAQNNGYDYLVREVEVTDVFEIDENGVKPACEPKSKSCRLIGALSDKAFH